jgi:hypothetical protein
MKLGDRVATPRFLRVRIAAMFESIELAENCGFTESTDFRDETYHIRGKSVGENKMVFAAINRS